MQTDADILFGQPARTKNAIALIPNALELTQRPEAACLLLYPLASNLQSYHFEPNDSIQGDLEFPDSWTTPLSPTDICGSGHTPIEREGEGENPSSANPVKKGVEFSFFECYIVL